MKKTKIIPQDIGAEQSLLCAVLIDSRITPEIQQIINPEDFYREAHNLIFKSIVSLHQKGSSIDPITIADALGDKLALAGGADYLTTLVGAASTSVGWKAHAEIIRKLSDRRKIIELCGQVVETSFQQDAEDTLPLLKDGIRQIEKSQDSPLEDNQKLYNTVYHQIYEKKEPGLYTGIECLKDRIYFEPGYIHAVAAESGVGKSAFILQVGDNISRNYGPALLYSLESTRNKLALRQIARYSRVALTRLNKSHIDSPDQEERLMEAVGTLVESRLILIDDIRYQEVECLCSHAESYALRHKISALFIDFLQLMSSRKKHNTRHHEISYIVNCFKGLAKDLNIPLIYASQLRKDVKGRPDLDTLKESGDIRTSTDNILFLYAPDPEPTIYPVEIFLGKGKEQERFSQWLEFNGNYQKFTVGEAPTKNYKSKNWQDDI